MFIASLFTTAKTWKQYKCPLTKEWIKKMWYKYTVEYQSAIKKYETRPFTATWMDLESVIQSDVHQTEKKKYRISQMNLQNRKRQAQKTNRVTGIRDSYGVWEGHVHTAIFNMDNQQAPIIQHM